MGDELLTIGRVVRLDDQQELELRPIVRLLQHPPVTGVVHGERAGVLSRERHVWMWPQDSRSRNRRTPRRLCVAACSQTDTVWSPNRMAEHDTRSSGGSAS